MDSKFCGLFKFKGNYYLVRLANANGPNFMSSLPEDIGGSLLGVDLELLLGGALDDYHSIGRSLTPEEWLDIGQPILKMFGEKNSSSFQRKKKDLTIRNDVLDGLFHLFDGSSGKCLGTFGNLKEVIEEVNKILS